MATKMEKILQIELPEGRYRMTKIHDDGTLEVKDTGYLHRNPIKVGDVAVVGSVNHWWRTSLIQEIELVGKGVKVLTLNSVYLIERV